MARRSKKTVPEEPIAERISDVDVGEEMRDSFLEYAYSVIYSRAIPDARDGLKPVQRRILYSLHENDDGKFIKVANIVGHTMQYHPHGDASIGDALVTLANKGYLIEGQGNFGNPVTGHAAAAPRYIECRLTDRVAIRVGGDGNPAAQLAVHLHEKGVEKFDPTNTGGAVYHKDAFDLAITSTTFSQNSGYWASMLA